MNGINTTSVTELPKPAGELGFTTPVQPGFRARPTTPNIGTNSRGTFLARVASDRRALVGAKIVFANERRALKEERKALDPELKSLRRERALLARQRGTQAAKTQIAQLESDIATLQGGPADPFANVQTAGSAPEASSTPSTKLSSSTLLAIGAVVLVIVLMRKGGK